MFTPLIVMTLILGVYPVLALDLIGPSVQTLVENYNTAISVAGVSGNIMITGQ